MLYVLSCASRLLIYLSCNEEIRSAFYDFLCANWMCKRRRENGIEYEFDEKIALQRHGSTQYTPVRQCSYRYFLKIIIKFLISLKKLFFINFL